MNSHISRLISSAALLCLCVSITALPAAEKPDEGDASTPNLQRGPDGLPLYKHRYSDGLYSTVTAINTFPDLVVKKQKKIKLKVPGFRKDVTAYSIMQDYKAPLVVVLMGMDGKVEGPWGCLFPYWYNEYNYHVLTFDNSFTSQYPEINGQGPVGNFEEESNQIAATIQAFLQTDEAKKNVTDVGVIGISFGATQALLLAKQHKAGKLPFELSGCLALSPPLRLKTTAVTLDRFFREDRWNTTMVELAKKFGTHVPVEEGVPIPFQPTEMRAAIGYVFRDGLTKVVEKNDRVYHLKQLPSEDSGEDRQSYAEAVNFARYMEMFVYPWWQKKGKVNSPDDLWDMADLIKIIPNLPPYAEAVIAANDPFNDQAELAQAQALDTNHNLTVLPIGGHLGFIASDWILVKALRIFNRRTAELSRPQPRAEPPPAEKPKTK